MISTQPSSSYGTAERQSLFASRCPRRQSRIVAWRLWSLREGTSSNSWRPRMSKNEYFPRLDKLGRRHKLLLIAINLLLLFIVTSVLLTTTEAPVVLYQAF